MRPRPSDHARPQFPQGLSFPLLLTPVIPVLLWGAERRSRGDLSSRGRSHLSVCLSRVEGRLSPDGSLTAPGRSYSTHRGQGSGTTGSGVPCWRRCRTGWGHRGTATASSRARWRLSTAERARRAGGAGGRRRGLASFAGQRFQPCPPLLCVSGVGRGVLACSVPARERPCSGRRAQSPTGGCIQRSCVGSRLAVLSRPLQSLATREEAVAGSPSQGCREATVAQGKHEVPGFLEALYSHIQSLCSSVTVWSCSFPGKSVLVLTWDIS